MVPAEAGLGLAPFQVLSAFAGEAVELSLSHYGAKAASVTEVTAEGNPGKL